MKMMRLPVVFVAAGFFLTVTAWGNSAPSPASNPCAVSGVLDLRNRDFHRDGAISLSGTWEVYWDTVASPVELPSLSSEKKADYVRVPHRWHQVGKSHSTTVATYRLKILRSDTSMPMALKLSFWICAYKLWVNGALIREEGRIARDERNNLFTWRSDCIPFQATGGEMDIVVAMSSSLFSVFSGFSPPMILGTPEQLRRIWGINISLKAIMTACFLFFLIIGLLFFILGGKRQLGYVYLGLFDLTLVMPFLILNGNDPAFFFPQIPYRFFVYLVLNDFFNFIFLLLSFRSFFPEETPKPVVALPVAIFCVFGLAMLFSHQFRVSDLYYFSDLVLSVVYNLISTIIIIFAVIHQRNNSILIFSGVILFQLISMVAQYAIGFAPDQPVLYSIEYLGTTALIGSQLLVIALDFARSQRESAFHREQLGHAEKLATLGTVVAGVAHEINNPNNAILLDAQTQRKALQAMFPVLDEALEKEGNFQICGLGYTELKDELAKASERLVRNSQRISRIVSDLKTLSKKEVDMNEQIDLNAVIDSASDVIDHFIKGRTRNFQVNHGASLPHVKGNTQYLEQVVINLIKNACQALTDMDKGVFVSTRYDQQAKRVVLSVRDEGRGMDAQTCQNLFVPFFSTKGKEGTGLGLSICNNIVKAHGGKMEISSDVNKGTDILVSLPCIETTPA